MALVEVGGIADFFAGAGIFSFFLASAFYLFYCCGARRDLDSVGAGGCSDLI